jgi:hypothetical protein
MSWARRIHKEKLDKLKGNRDLVPHKNAVLCYQARQLVESRSTVGVLCLTDWRILVQGFEERGRC